MIFPELVPVTLVLRKTNEETIDDATWLTYSLEGAPGIRLDFQIEAGSFDEQDMKGLEEVLAVDLAEEIVRTVRAQASGRPLN